MAFLSEAVTFGGARSLSSCSWPSSGGRLRLMLLASSRVFTTTWKPFHSNNGQNKILLISNYNVILQ